MNTPRKENKSHCTPDGKRPSADQLRKQDEDIIKGARNTDQLDGLRPKKDEENDHQAGNETGMGPAEDKTT
jgi:hypothetical protein